MRLRGVESNKFSGVLLEENVAWKSHTKYIENKITKYNKSKINLVEEHKIIINKNVKLTRASSGMQRTNGKNVISDDLKSVSLDCFCSSFDVCWRGRY